MRSFVAISLLLLMLTGCVAEDPMRVAMAKEKTIWAENTKAAQAAQLDRSAMAEADARNAQAMVLALQSQQAIVAGQAAQAQAMAQVEVVRVMAEAKRSDNTLAIVVVVVLGVVAGVWIVASARNARLKPDYSTPPPRLLPRDKVPMGMAGWLLPDGRIQLEDMGDGRRRLLTVERYREVTGIEVRQ